MNKARKCSVVLGLLLAWNAGSCLEAQDTGGRFDHAPLDRLLATYVDDAGFVNYAGLKQNRAGLDKIVSEMARTSPDNAPAVFPTREAQLAYWINAYNAEILRDVVDHYPTSSITRIGLIPFGAFFIERIELGGKKLTLRSLENDVIRERFHDARIHFAINCASRSCPPLARHAYQPEKLEAQLEDAARAFINDDRQVTLDEAGGRVVLSKIFDWYASDFKEAYAARFHRSGGVTDYLKVYSTPERRKILEKLSGAKVTYHDYDWGLNDRVTKGPLR